MSPKSGSEPLSEGELANGYSLSRIARDGEDVTLTVAGEVDIANAEDFTDQVRSLIEGAGDQVTLDLQNCRFIDSTGIRALVVLAQEQRAQGRRLELSGVRGEPRRALGLTGLLDSDLFARVSDNGHRSQL
jgi:anti-sigma B factor antagonist